MKEAKNIVLLGASGLIGKAIYDSLINDHYDVYIMDLTNPLGYENFFEVDLFSIDSVKSSLEALDNLNIRFHGFVNVAYPRTSDWSRNLEEVSYESLCTNINAQLTMAIVLMRFFAERFKQSGGGRIINFGSIYGVNGPDFELYHDLSNMTVPVAYSAIKSGIINVTKYFASYYGKDKVCFNCISPGGVADNQNELFLERYEAKVPLGRLAKPEEISGLVAFLLGDDSSYITGQNIMVDGGWTSV